MIEFITRKEALTGNKAFESHIFRSQEGLYNPMNPDNRTVIGDEQWDAFQSEFRPFYTQEECDAHDAKLYERYLEKKDTIQDHGLNPILIKCYAASHTTNNKRETDWGIWIPKLIEYLSETSITFLLDYDIPWQARGRDRDREVNKRLKYFKKIGVGAYFGGGIKATEEDSTHVFNSIYNLTIIDGLYPYCWFRIGNQPLVGTVSSDGNLEMYLFEEQVLAKVEQFIVDQNITELKDC